MVAWYCYGFKGVVILVACVLFCANLCKCFCNCFERMWSLKNTNNNINNFSICIFVSVFPTKRLWSRFLLCFNSKYSCKFQWNCYCSNSVFAIILEKNELMSFNYTACLSTIFQMVFPMWWGAHGRSSYGYDGFQLIAPGHVLKGVFRFCLR